MHASHNPEVAGAIAPEGGTGPVTTTVGLNAEQVETIVQRATAAIPRLAYSPNEAAEALGVSRDYMDEHIGPELRWVRRGRRKLVALAELERWLDRAAAGRSSRESGGLR